MMQTDVKAAHVEATGTMVDYRTRVKGYQFLGGGTAGDIILRDGGASGTILNKFLNKNVIITRETTNKRASCGPLSFVNSEILKYNKSVP